MCAKWIQDFKQEQITTRIDKIKTVKDGKVSYSGFAYEDYMATIESMVEFKTDIPIYLKRSILSNSINETALKGSITPTKLIASISRNENKYLNKHTRPFILATHLTIQNNITLPSIKLQNGHLHFTKYLPRHFANKRYEMEKNAESIFNFKTIKNSMAARIRVYAKEEHDAAYTAIDCIDYYRSIVNLLINPSFRMSFGGPPSPVNNVLLGPVHSLHNLNGNLATKLYWYQPDFKKDKTINIFTQRTVLLKNISFIRQKIKRLHYADELREILLRHVRALDYPEYNTAFIHLWGVLENLTDTKDSSYKVTIKRAASMFTNFEYNKQVLIHLKNYRNGLIHLGKTYNEIEPYIYQLKRYVHQLFMFLIVNRFNFQSIKEATEFMDLPQDKKALNKYHNLIRNAIKFREVNTDT